jgi:hypothetical protein
MSDDQMTNEEWLAIRKEAGLHIDPETAELRWDYAEMSDPYCLYPMVEGPGQQVGREYFARSPGSDVWVWVGDLPDATADALGKRIEKSRDFGAPLNRTS